MIPHILHQTWRDYALPEPFTQLSATWRDRHPDWTWRLWTDVDNRAFVAKEFPHLLELYDSYPYPIQRVDAVRYMILLRLGGLFVDLDFEALRPLDPLLSSGCVFGVEPEENCAIHGRTRIISNALMAARPGHPFLAQVVNGLAEAKAHFSDRNTAILESTGPFFLTRMHAAYNGDDPVTLLPSHAIYPFGISDIEQLRKAGWTAALTEKAAAAHAVHYHAGTWWRAQSIAPPHA